MVLLGLVIVVVYIDAKLDLFYGDRLLVLLRFALFLFLLVQIFPVIVHTIIDHPPLELMANLFRDGSLPIAPGVSPQALLA